MDREAREIRGRMEKWTRYTRVKYVLQLVPWAFVITGPLLMVVGVWDPGASLAVRPDRPIYSTVMIVGTLLSIWYLTRLWTFSDAKSLLEAEREAAEETARKETERLRGLLSRLGIDPDTGRPWSRGDVSRVDSEMGETWEGPPGAR